MQDLALSTQLL